MPLDRWDTDKQGVGDRPVGLAHRDQLKHFFLASSQDRSKRTRRFIREIVYLETLVFASEPWLCAGQHLRTSIVVQVGSKTGRAQLLDDGKDLPLTRKRPMQGTPRLVASQVMYY